MDDTYEPETMEVKSELSFFVLLRKLNGSELVRKRKEGEEKKGYLFFPKAGNYMF
ncbi:MULTISPECIES: hypothetical protein [unclassified Akkermansia]|uniref:hypothetical protein n=1 Tax=unclassified Akkermansia TaxID=2608915 RepID=UPI0012E93F4F|nr:MULTISPECIES: hypothetical protein [unclassified Akkermansia]